MNSIFTFNCIIEETLRRYFKWSKKVLGIITFAMTTEVVCTLHHPAHVWKPKHGLQATKQIGLSHKFKSGSEPMGRVAVVGITPSPWPPVPYFFACSCHCKCSLSTSSWFVPLCVAWEWMWGRVETKNLGHLLWD